MSTRPVPRAAWVLAALALAPIGLQWLPSEDGFSAAAKVVLAALAVGVAPGAVLVLLCRPKPVISILELMGLGVATSFCLVHLLTVLAVVAHLPAWWVLIGLCSTTTVATIWMGWRGTPGVVIRVRREEMILGGLLILLGVALYLRGSPIVSFEDQVHASIVRRLAEIEAPTLDNIYFAPHIVYTYPFPGVHYLMALISRAGDVDALFVYDKLRCFWGPAAIVMLFLAARSVFGTLGVATAVGFTAIALASSGVFAEVPKTFWAQLVPYSHPSDVAIGIVLPGLLVAAFGYLQSEIRRERNFMLALSLLLISMLSMVHIREIIQFLTYIGAFILFLAIFRAHRPQMRRAFVLLVSTLVVSVPYLAWHSASVMVVADLVRNQRDKLVGIAARSSVSELLFAEPRNLLGDFFFSVEPLFEGLTPFVLFAGPLVIFAFRHRPLIWFVSSSTLVYLALMSVPVLAIPYIYLTYYEIFLCRSDISSSSCICRLAPLSTCASRPPLDSPRSGCSPRLRAAPCLASPP